MKNYLKAILPVILFFLLADVQAQKKRSTSARHTAHKTTTKIVEKNLGSPTSISQITDVLPADVAYESLKNLIEMHSVTLTYDDNTFRGKELLKRGDFVVALNSALISLKKNMDTYSLDTSLMNTYDRNRNGSYLTTIDQVKDISDKSIYYASAKSLIERWGIAEPFSLTKTLNANSTLPEKEVYDILRVTLGYNSPGINPYSAGMSRNKFAIVLNNALSQKMTEINTLHSVQQARREDERKRQMDSLEVVENARKDSVRKELQIRKAEAEKQEIEAKKKLKEKHRR